MGRAVNREVLSWAVLYMALQVVISRVVRNSLQNVILLEKDRTESVMLWSILLAEFSFNAPFLERAFFRNETAKKCREERFRRYPMSIQLMVQTLGQMLFLSNS